MFYVIWLAVPPLGKTQKWYKNLIMYEKDCTVIDLQLKYGYNECVKGSSLICAEKDVSIC